MAPHLHLHPLSLSLPGYPSSSTACLAGVHSSLTTVMRPVHHVWTSDLYFHTLRRVESSLTSSHSPPGLTQGGRADDKDVCDTYDRKIWFQLTAEDDMAGGEVCEWWVWRSWNFGRSPNTIHHARPSATGTVLSPSSPLTFASASDAGRPRTRIRPGQGQRDGGMQASEPIPRVGSSHVYGSDLPLDRDTDTKFLTHLSVSLFEMARNHEKHINLKRRRHCDRQEEVCS